MLASYTCGATTERLISEEGDVRTYYLWSGSRVITEYTEVGSSTQPVWTKQYVYLGARLLAVMQPSGGGSERVEFHHPDRLGTRLVTSSQDGSYYEQVTLPFGVALEAESSGATNRRFTSYDRSSVTGLDYAVNRHYDPLQGRFTQVDPIGMKSVDLTDPQTLNLYSYCANDPVNHLDPDGLFFKKLFGFIGKVFKWIAVAAAVAVVVVAVVTIGAVPILTTLQLLLSSASTLANTFGQKKLGMVLGIAAAGLGLYQNWGKAGIIWNYSETGRSSAERLAAWAAGVGAIANLLSQTVPKGTSEKFKKALDEAFKDAEQRLQKEKCANLFGGKDKALATLRGTEYRYLPFSPEDGPRLDPKTGEPTVTGAATVSSTLVFINSRGPFLNQRLPVPGKSGFVKFDFGTGLSGKRFRSLILLHELGHQTKVFGPDAGDPKLNREHTQRVLDACF